MIFSTKLVASLAHFGFSQFATVGLRPSSFLQGKAQTSLALRLLRASVPTRHLFSCAVILPQAIFEESLRQMYLRHLAVSRSANSDRRAQQLAVSITPRSVICSSQILIIVSLNAATYLARSSMACCSVSCFSIEID